MNLQLEEKLNRLEECGKLTFEKDKSLAGCSTFRIGGRAKYAVYPKNSEGIAELLKVLSSDNIPYRIVGAGSNILFPDEGYDGAVIFTSGLRNMESNGNIIRAGAGVPLSSLAVKACSLGLSGAEGLFGIPGSVGGAVYMNAGAYDYSVADILSESRWIDIETGEIGKYSAAEHGFDYRHSVYMSENKIITEAVFTFKNDSTDAIKARMDDFIARRKSKQPLEYPSAGSTFKRYPGYYTGKLIEDAGLKGYTIGGARVSEKHAGFVINIGNATAKDVKELITHIEKVIYSKYGIHIEREVIYF